MERAKGKGMKKRIWFNHWFSTVTNIMDLIKQEVAGVEKLTGLDSGEELEFKIIATNDVENPLIKEHADEWYLEPKGLDKEHYIEWCKNFISENNIDIFIPRRNRLWVSEYKNDLGAIVIVADFKTEKLLNDKARAYNKMLSSKDLKKYVPDFIPINSEDSFITAMEEMSRVHKELCMKLCVDEGGASFVEIITNEPSWNDLIYGGYERRKMSYSSICRILGEKARQDWKDFWAGEKAGSSGEKGSGEKEKNLGVKEKGSGVKERGSNSFMIMPLLYNEISCDCLGTDKEFICIAREKIKGHCEIVSSNKELTDICKKIYEYFGLKGISNIQFRHAKDGKAYLLEINTRMSGGVQIGCLGAGINLPLRLILKNLGIEVEKADTFVEKKVLSLNSYKVVEEEELL